MVPPIFSTDIIITFIHSLNFVNSQHFISQLLCPGPRDTKVNRKKEWESKLWTLSSLLVNSLANPPLFGLSHSFSDCHRHRHCQHCRHHPFSFWSTTSAKPRSNRSCECFSFFYLDFLLLLLLLLLFLFPLHKQTAYAWVAKLCRGCFEDNHHHHYHHHHHHQH